MQQKQDMSQVEMHSQIAINKVILYK